MVVLENEHEIFLILQGIFRYSLSKSWEIGFKTGYEFKYCATCFRFKIAQEKGMAQQELWKPTPKKYVSEYNQNRLNGRNTNDIICIIWFPFELCYEYLFISRSEVNIET